MKVSIIKTDSEVVVLDLPSDLDLTSFRAIVEAELEHANFSLLKDGRELESLVDGDLIRVVMGSKPSTTKPKVDWGKQVGDALKAAHINANMQAALEHHPEAFAPVSMLFVRMTVNGHLLNGFVDSGAQSTIISKECAERCGIGHLVDERFSGIARGVGTGKIVGRIHAVIIAVGSLHLSCALTVMEGNIGPDVIFGLDMLKRHQVPIMFYSYYICRRSLISIKMH